MTEHPLLCNSEVVRAILAGRQTQDRRPVTERYCFSDAGLKKGVNEICLEKAWAVTDKSYLRVPYRHVDDAGIPWEDCGSVRVNPKYRPGDILWVREKWTPLYRMYTNILVGACFRHLGGGRVFNEQHDNSDGINDLCGFKPSIHMPKWACRLRLTVKRVWVERVQDISEADAEAEGLLQTEDYKWLPGVCDYPQWAFKDLWDSLYPGSWDRNDWVFACEFEKG